MANQATFSFEASGGPERIAKRIARAGVCSRRAAETFISEGRVTVNGEVIDSPALNVTMQDVITIDGKPLPAREPARLWRYHKPRGLVVTARDEKDRETIFDSLPAHMPRVISVGRLDIDSEGLILLTNDGGLARHLELPSTGWGRKYRVRVQGHVDQAALAGIADGVTIDGVRYGEVNARLDRQMASNAWVTITIREGKNREVRRIMEYLGHQVSRLIRVSYGPFMLGDIAAGAVEEIKPRVLADQLGVDAPPEPIGRAVAKTGNRPKRQNAKGNPGNRGKNVGREATGAQTRGGKSGSARGRQQDADHRRPSSRHKAGATRRRTDKTNR